MSGSAAIDTHTKRYWAAAERKTPHNHIHTHTHTHTHYNDLLPEPEDRNGRH